MTTAKQIADMILSNVQIGSHVEAGYGEDYDTGRVESIEGDAAFVAWDSGVKTVAAVSRLRVLQA